MTDGPAGCSRSRCSRRSPAPADHDLPIAPGGRQLARRARGRRATPGPRAPRRRRAGQFPRVRRDDPARPGDLPRHPLRNAGSRWTPGSIHGLRSASGGEAFDLACLVPGTAEVAGLVRVRATGPSRSVVEPLGSQPADIAYEAVMALVPAARRDRTLRAVGFGPPMPTSGSARRCRTPGPLARHRRTSMWRTVRRARSVPGTRRGQLTP